MNNNALDYNDKTIRELSLLSDLDLILLVMPGMGGITQFENKHNINGRYDNVMEKAKMVLGYRKNNSCKNCDNNSYNNKNNNKRFYR